MQNIYLLSELDRWLNDLSSYFTLKAGLFGAVKLTKNADPDKYSYFRFDIGFILLHSLFDWGKKVVIFGVDNSSPMHADNKTKHIFVLGEGPTQGLDDTMITVGT